MVGNSKHKVKELISLSPIRCNYYFEVVKQFIKLLIRLHRLNYEKKKKKSSIGKCDYQVNNQCSCTTLVSELLSLWMGLH